MIFTKTYQMLPLVTNGYHSLPLVTSKYQILENNKNSRKKPQKLHFCEKGSPLVTIGYHSLPMVAKLQKTKEKEPKRKIKIYFMGFRDLVLGIRFED